MVTAATAVVEFETVDGLQVQLNLKVDDGRVRQANDVLTQIIDIIQDYLDDQDVVTSYREVSPYSLGTISTEADCCPASPLNKDEF